MEEPQRDIRLSSSRFSGFSDGIVLKRLERESNRLLLYGLFVAVLLHLALASLWTSHQHNAKALKPLSVELRIVPPRMTKPFRISAPQHIRTMRKLTKSRDLSMLPGANYISPASKVLEDHVPVLESSLLTDSNSYDSAKYDTGEFTPAFPRFVDTITRNPDRVISLKDELLTIDDLDRMLSDQYKGLIVYNPNDPNALTGYLYLPHVYTSFSRKNISPGIIKLATAVSAMTGIKAKVDHQVMLPPQDTDTIMSPFLYIFVGERWEYFPAEAKAIADYVYDGGFVMFEGFSIPGEVSLQQFIKDAFGSKARLEIIPDDHPIYHTLFDFDDGPPVGSEFFPTRNPKLKARKKPAGSNEQMLPPNMRKPKKAAHMAITTDENSVGKPVKYLEGIFLDGRLAVIYTNKGYSLTWGSINLASKMGVNIVLYAMSQVDKRIASKTDYSLPENTNMKNSSYQPIRMKKNDSLWKQ